ncbi:MAG: hypothetical protein ACTSQZ_09410 [Candidatus Thorarchaeota archaeon]
MDESQLGGNTMSDTPKHDSTLVYNSMKLGYSIFFILLISYLIGGYLIVLQYIQLATLDLLWLFGVFLGLPSLVLLIGFYIGWNMKKRTVNYTSPEWNFEPTQYTLDDAKSAFRKHNKTNSRLVATPNYWLYFLPIILLIFQFTLPLYVSLIDSSLNASIPLLFSGCLGALHVITFLGGWRSTSNTATNDFNLKLIRETLILGKVQSKTPGISQVRFVIDVANHDDLTIYSNPRVVLRIKGIETSAYIETWTQDIKAIERMHMKILKDDANEEIVWWWVSGDRDYRKFIGDDEYGYYIKIPIESRIQELGVKDVALVTKNAIAIIILEWIRTRGENDEISQILSELGVTSTTSKT